MADTHGHAEHKHDEHGHGHPHGHGPGDHGQGGHDHRAHGHGGHGGGHGHSHVPTEFGRAFVIGIVLNVGIVLLQAVYGWLSNSVALLADAGHNLSDVLGLVVAFWASSLARRPASPRYTYGLGGSTILAALFNAVFLLVAVGALSWEAIGRVLAPQPVAGGTVMAVAAIGMVLNGFTAWLFAGGRHGDLNVRGAYLHMMADAAVSAGVVIAGLLILVTGAVWIDPVVSLGVNAVIVWGTWGLLRDSLASTLGAVPPSIDPVAVRTAIAGQPGIAALHDLHIWPISTTQTALTAHLVMPDGHPGDPFITRLADTLKREFAIGHVTFQIETDPATRCGHGCEGAHA